MSRKAVAASTSNGCPLCGVAGGILFDGIRDFHVKDGESPEFAVHGCQTCEVAYTLPALTDTELSQYYPEDYEAYVRRKGLREWLQRVKYRSDLKKIIRFADRRDPLSLYEVGAGRGEFLAEAKRAGHSVCGVEPSAAGRRTAKETFQIALDAGFGESLVFSRRYDVVIARHSLEHMNLPGLALERIAKSGLAPGGTLFLKIPCFDAWEVKAFGNYWCGWDLPRHRIHFTSLGICRALERAGFSDIHITREVVPIDLDRSFLFLGKFGKNGGVSFFATLWGILPHGLRLLLLQPLALLLSPLGVGRIIVQARGPGGNR